MTAPRVVVTEPTKARILNVDPVDIDRLKASLTYTDEKIRFELQRLKRSSWYAEQHGYDAWQEKVNDLKSQVKKCLLFADEQGLWTYSGLAEKAAGLLSTTVENRVVYPDDGALGWDKKPEFEMYPYQKTSMERLQAVKHGGVEIGTGLGKSFIILNLVKELGMRTVIMAPSTDIARRLYEDCQIAFGKKYVGLYGDGKKEFKKLITVAIAQSLTRCEEDSDAWRHLSRAKVFVADESHQCAAKTLAKVCFGLMASVPYRFFFSATQLRTDGLDLLLEAIVGPIVYTMTVREGIDQGFLAKLQFAMLLLHSNSAFESADANEMTREHLYYNDSVYTQIGDMINNFVEQYDQQVLVLVEEVEQFTKLYPHLRVPAKFAHGGLTATAYHQNGKVKTQGNKDKVPETFHKSDPSRFVKEFNAGEFPVLVGTSCVSTGTDIKANEVTVNLQGGKSLIAVMQGPSGRSTRLFEYKPGRKWRRTPGKKTSCTVIDVDVANIDITHKHARERAKIYDSIYGPVRDLHYES